MRTDRLSEKNERKGSTRERILTQVRHDGRRSEAVAHLGKRERGIFRHQHEVAYNRQAEAESKRVALYFGNADERRSAQSVLEFDEPRRFFANGVRVTSRAFAPSAKDFAACPDSQDSRGGICGFGTQRGPPRAKHFSGDFVPVVAVGERKRDNIGA